MKKLSINKLLTSLITVIDEHNYILKNHHRNVSVIAYIIGKAINISDQSMQNLVLAAAIHDIGAINIEDAVKLKVLDMENTEKHQRIGSNILEAVDGFSYIAKIVKHHHVNFVDYTMDIPYESLILHLADRLDILIDHEEDYLEQRFTITKAINERKNIKFDPELVDVVTNLMVSDIFWHDIKHKSFKNLLKESIADESFIEFSFENLKSVAIMFSRISDFRNKYFATHSLGVGIVTHELARIAGLSEEECQILEITGYLHDIGKLAINSEILSKKEKLSSEEFEEVKKHSYFTRRFLENIDGLEEIAYIASAHHEKHDGKGYPYQLKKEQFTTAIDILAISDIFCALREDRSYKGVYSKEECISIFKDCFIEVLDREIINMLIENIHVIDEKRLKHQKRARKFYLESIGVVEAINREPSL